MGCLVSCGEDMCVKYGMYGKCFVSWKIQYNFCLRSVIYVKRIRDAIRNVEFMMPIGTR